MSGMALEKQEYLGVSEEYIVKNDKVSKEQMFDNAEKILTKENGEYKVCLHFQSSKQDIRHNIMEVLKQEYIKNNTKEGMTNENSTCAL